MSLFKRQEATTRKPGTIDLNEEGFDPDGMKIGDKPTFAPGEMKQLTKEVIAHFSSNPQIITRLGFETLKKAEKAE